MLLLPLVIRLFKAVISLFAACGGPAGHPVGEKAGIGGVTQQSVQRRQTTRGGQGTSVGTAVGALQRRRVFMTRSLIERTTGVSNGPHVRLRVYRMDYCIIPVCRMGHMCIEWMTCVSTGHMCMEWTSCVSDGSRVCRINHARIEWITFVENGYHVYRMDCTCIEWTTSVSNGPRAYQALLCSHDMHVICDDTGPDFWRRGKERMNHNKKIHTHTQQYALQHGHHGIYRSTMCFENAHASRTDCSSSTPLQQQE